MARRHEEGRISCHSDVRAERWRGGAGLSGYHSTDCVGRVLEKESFRFAGSKIPVRNTTKGVAWTGGCVGVKARRSELDLNFEIFNIRMGLRL